MSDKQNGFDIWNAMMILISQALGVNIIEVDDSCKTYCEPYQDDVELVRYYSAEKLLDDDDLYVVSCATALARRAMCMVKDNPCAHKIIWSGYTGETMLDSNGESIFIASAALGVANR